MHSEAAWSLVDTRPVTLYLSHINAHIVYWNGVGTTRSNALMIMAHVWNNVWSTPTMKLRAWNEFNRIYQANGFMTRAWDQKVSNLNADTYKQYITLCICRQNMNFFPRLKEQYTAQQALEWFHTKNEILKYE